MKTAIIEFVLTLLSDKYCVKFLGKTHNDHVNRCLFFGGSLKSVDDC